MLDKKKIQVNFLFNFKMGRKQHRQLTTSTKHLAQELLMNSAVVQCSAVVVQEVLQRRLELSI